MLLGLIRFSLRHAGTVILVACMALFGAGYQLLHAQYDVFPEFAPPQVTIQTEAPGMSSEQVEMLITQRIEEAVQGVGGITALRSSSLQGLSAVDVFFDLSSDVVQDRQAINERISGLSSSLPAGVAPPVMNPLTSSTNNVMGIGLTSDTLDLTQLRTLADRQLRPRLLGVGGVADVESYGGRVRRIEVEVDPAQLVHYGLSLSDVTAEVQKVTGIRGGGVVDTQKTRFTIQLDNDNPTLDQIGNMPIIRGTAESVDLAIQLKDIAHIREGFETAFSAASIMGKPGVLLMVTSQYGANTLDVTQEVEHALAELKPVLTEQHVNVWGEIIRPASFIETSLHNVTSALYLGAAFVILVLILFLRNWRAALITTLAIPFSLGIAAATLLWFGQSLNTMTLGGLAIAVGLVVDDAVIDVENMLRRLRLHGSLSSAQRKQTLLEASMQVRKPVLFATLALVLASVPIMTLPDLSGRFFAPLGLAYALATLFSLLVALTLTPALSVFLLHERRTDTPRLSAWLQKYYTRLLNFFHRAPLPLVILILILLVVSGIGGARLQGEFLPVLHEGHFIVHMEAESGTSLEESIRLGNLVTQELRKLPFITTVAQQVGRTEQGIDIWGTNISEFNVAIDPATTVSEEDAEQQIQDVLAKFPDLSFEVNTFLTERVEEVISGYTSNAVLNIYGQNLDALDGALEKVTALLKQTPGVKNVQTPAQTGLPQLSITLKRDGLEKYGLSATDVMDTIHAAYQGDIATQIYEGTYAVNVTVLLPETVRSRPEDIAKLSLHTPSGVYIPLEAVADVRETNGRYLILHETGQRVQTLAFDLDAANQKAKLASIRKEIEKQKLLPEGMYVSVISLAEAAAKSRSELLIHSALAGFSIFALLSLVFRSQRELWLILLNIPFALTGGVIAILLSHQSLSLGALVGFLTLFGITLRNSVMLLSHYDYLVTQEHHPWNWKTAIQGSEERLLPILMTALITGLGLLPLALGSAQAGREIEGPMALVILGGLITSTILNLLVIPLLAYRFCDFRSDTDELVLSPPAQE